MPAILPVSASAAPLKVFVSRPMKGTATNITRIIDRDSIRIEESGNRESATMDFTFSDLAADLPWAAMRGQWRVRAEYTIPGTSTTKMLFNGIIRRPRHEAKAIYGGRSVSADDIGSQLDRIVIGVKDVERKAGEKADARLKWLFDRFWIGPGFKDWSRVRELEAHMPKQRFPANLTMRQAVERILAAASPSGNYFVDYVPKLWTWDDDSRWTAFTAPYDIEAVAAPGAGAIAPEALEVEFDSEPYRNGYYVEAANRKLSKFYTDASAALGMPGPHASKIYGDAFDRLSAPDADTQAKVERVVKAALRDTRNPIPRITFAVKGTDAWSGTKMWQGGQYLYVTSAIHGLTGSTVDTRWAGSDSAGQQLQPFRVVRATTTLLDGGQTLMVELELGGRRAHLFSPG